MQYCSPYIGQKLYLFKSVDHPFNILALLSTLLDVQLYMLYILPIRLCWPVGLMLITHPQLLLFIHFVTVLIISIL